MNLRFLTKELVYVFILTFALALGMELIQPLFPLYLQDLGATVLEVSIVVSISGVLSSIVMVPSGIASDIFGRKKLILISFIMTLAVFFYTLVDRWEYVIPWAMIFTASFSVFLPARMALIADQTTPESRAITYSVINTAWPVGGILGPSLAGLVVERYGWNTLFYAVTLMFILCLPISLMLKDKGYRSEDKSESLMEIRLAEKSSESDRIWYRISGLFFLLTFFSGLGSGSISAVFPIYLNRMFLLSESQIGLFLSMGFGVGALISQIPSAMLAKKFGKKNIFLFSLVTTPVLMFLMSLMKSYVALLITYILFYFFWSMSWPVSISLLMDLTPSSKRGVASSIRSLGFRIGMTLGPVIGGIFWVFISPTAVFWIASIFLLVCIPVLLFLPRITEI